MKIRLMGYFWLALLALLVGIATPYVAKTPKPNIVFILADDQGWTGLSERMDPEIPESRSDYYQTPNLARLVKEGMRFKNGYAPAPVCSPTRHSIQFGIMPAKTRVTHNNASERQFCDPELALAQLIKTADSDYATAHFGKWHITKLDPASCGYDESDGSTGNKDGSNSKNSEDPKRVFEITERSIGFMEKQVKAGRPFFLQISHYADHLTFRARPSSKKKYEDLSPGKKHTDPEFAGMNEDLDAGVGMILDALSRLGIDGNTWVFYTADNGFDESPRTDRVAKASPLSYSKGFVWEGGIRVPFIVRGPKVRPGAVSAVRVSGIDLMPTFLEIVKPGFDLSKEIEGGSFLSVLRNDGKGEVKRANKFMVFHYPTGSWPAQTALIKGDYKLIKTWAFDRLELFSLKNDIGEMKNLSALKPEKADELHKNLMVYLKKVDAVFPSEDELAFDRSGPLIKKGRLNTGKNKKKKKSKKK